MPIYTGYTLLFVVILLGEAGFPLFAPAELLLFSAGVAAARGLAPLADLAAIALLADLLGGIALFALLRHGSRLTGRSRRLAALDLRARGAARRFGGASLPRIALGRSLPLLRVPSTFCASLAGMRPAAYLGASFAGGAVWISIFLGGGFLLAGVPLGL